MLKIRVITSIVALVVLGIILFVIPARAAELVIAAVVLAGAWEWSAFLGEPSNAVRAALSSLLPRQSGRCTVSRHGSLAWRYRLRASGGAALLCGSCFSRPRFRDLCAGSQGFSCSYRCLLP